MLHLMHESEYLPDTYDTVMRYILPLSILEAQRHLGIIPKDTLERIYHNLKILVDLE